MNAPATTFMSVRAYVLDRLTKSEEPLTSAQLAEGRPSYISEKSPGVAASKLYAMGVLGRKRVPTWSGGVTVAYYLAEDGLDKLPKDFSWEGVPGRGHHSPRPRRSIPEKRQYAGDDGVITQEEPDMTTLPSPEAPLESKPADQQRAAPPAVEPGVYVMLVTSAGARRVSVADAKALYAQLKELFG